MDREAPAAKRKILIVDDEPDIIQFIGDALADEGYEVLTAYNGADVFEHLSADPDLILLDVMMPGLDGLEVCRAIRERASCPILFLSAMGREEDRIKGLMAGGDDYLVKPLSTLELKARIRAHLRREERSAAGKLRAVVYDGDLTLDALSYSVHIGHHPLPLTPREFEIVQFLLTHPRQVFSREQIYERVWGLEATGDASTVTEHIKKVRAKLAEIEPDRVFITTVWGVGYKWEPGQG